MTDQPIDLVFKILIFGVPCLFALSALLVLFWVARNGGGGE